MIELDTKPLIHAATQKQIYEEPFKCKHHTYQCTHTVNNENGVNKCECCGSDCNGSHCQCCRVDTKFIFDNKYINYISMVNYESLE